MDAKDLNLAIVSLGDVLLHEEIEIKRVDALVERLKTDRLLKNPPIVTAVNGAGGMRYIVLDGASRSSALRALKVRDVLVQIVDYHSSTLRLESWNHLLVNISSDELRRILSAATDAEQVEMSEAEAQRELSAREIIGYLKFKDGAVLGLRCSSDLADQAHELNRVVHAYEGQVELYRVASTDPDQPVANREQVVAVMVFPRYTPDEIVKLAMNGARVPMGITRHIIPGRALRLNVPLDVLESGDSLEQKNAWLDAWLQDKLKHRHVRYYQEPVILFDE